MRGPCCWRTLTTLTWFRWKWNRNDLPLWRRNLIYIGGGGVLVSFLSLCPLFHCWHASIYGTRDNSSSNNSKIKMVSCFNSCARWPPNSVAGDLILTWHLCSDKQDQRGNLVKKPIIQQVLLKLLLSKWQSDGHVRSANTSLPNHTQRHTQRTRLTSTSLLVVCFGCH